MTSDDAEFRRLRREARNVANALDDPIFKSHTSSE